MYVPTDWSWAAIISGLVSISSKRASSGRHDRYWRFQSPSRVFGSDRQAGRRLIFCPSRSHRRSPHSDSFGSWTFSYERKRKALCALLSFTTLYRDWSYCHWSVVAWIRRALPIILVHTCRLVLLSVLVCCHVSTKTFVPSQLFAHETHRPAFQSALSTPLSSHVDVYDPRKQWDIQKPYALRNPIHLGVNWPRAYGGSAPLGTSRTGARGQEQP